MPIVLVHNENVSPEYQWDDVEGVHYHFPTKYRGKVRAGEPFVYYRGVNRANGRRGPAEYLGAGIIGHSWPDPTRKKAWYCSVEDYERFPAPVPAKVDGVTREKISRNLWWDGVRALDPAVYDEILRDAATGGAPAKSSVPVQPQETHLTKVDDLILPSALAKQGGLGNGYRRSARSKAIGDWAERAALAYIQREVAGCSNCTHRAALGETPGWDIDYRDSDGLLHRVEVKGTVGAAFAAIELTANELEAANAHGDQYWLCLIARCETDQAKVQLIQNPAGQIAMGNWDSKPTLYAVRFSPSGA